MVKNTEYGPTYSLSEVLDFFGLKEEYETDQNARMHIIRQIKGDEFPFPGIKIRNKWYFPKKAVDEFLEGFNPRKHKPLWQKKSPGRPRRWNPDEVVHYNQPIPKKLDTLFNKVIYGINDSIPNPITKGDFLRLAIEEFITRRPEYLSQEDLEAINYEE